MERSAKRSVSVRLTPGKQKQLDGAVALIREHYGATLAAWHELTDEQRAEVLAHSPLLAKLVELLRPVYGE